MATQPSPVFLPGKSHGQRSLGAIVHGVAKSRTWQHNWTHAAQLRNSQMKELHRTRCRERDRSFHTLFRCVPLPKSSTQEALGTLSFWSFMKASLDRHDWLYHWPLAVDLTSIPSFLPLEEIPVLQLQGLSSWQPAGHLRCGPKVTSLT